MSKISFYTYGLLEAKIYAECGQSGWFRTMSIKGGDFIPKGHICDL